MYSIIRIISLWLLKYLILKVNDLKCTTIYYLLVAYTVFCVIESLNYS